MVEHVPNLKYLKLFLTFCVKHVKLLNIVKCFPFCATFLNLEITSLHFCQVLCNRSDLYVKNFHKEVIFTNAVILSH